MLDALQIYGQERNSKGQETFIKNTATDPDLVPSQKAIILLKLQ